MYTVKRKDGMGEAVECSAEGLMATCADKSEGGKHALDIDRTADEAPTVAAVEPDEATIPELPSSDLVEDDGPEPLPVDALPVSGAKPVSDFGKGNQIVDDSARVRIEAVHSALRSAGVGVDASKQLYATGTRMAAQGYATQAARRAEHDNKMPIRDAASALVSMVQAEGRDDVEVSARELGQSLNVNGKITAFGLCLSEQAIRGLCLRLESPALRYVLGLRDRIEAEKAKTEPSQNQIQADKRTLADVLRHECLSAPEARIKMRTRKGVGDIFAVVSPSYSPADVPETLPQIVDALPRDAKASYSYDPTSTAWELRANVWTPTPVAEQAVGEPFEAFASYTSRDNGTSRFRGGGGIVLLACLNAGTYSADTSAVSRRHMGDVLTDVEAMVSGSTAAIRAMCIAWGAARGETVEAPSGVTIEQAIPGFYRSLLTDRRSLLTSVLPGRTESHVTGLARAFAGERRDPSAPVNRADLAQGWTKYIQAERADVRRDAEAAIGAWMVQAPRIGCDVRATA